MLKTTYIDKYQRQQGVALPIALILLFVMTLVAIATLRTTTLEENMTASSRLRQTAFNAAETALTEAENVFINLRGTDRRELFFGNGFVTPSDTRPNVGDTCTNGFCVPAQFNSPVSTPANGERWEDPDLDVWNTPNRNIPYAGFANSNLQANGVINPPMYIIEFLGNFDFKGPNVGLAVNPTIRPEFANNYTGICREPLSNSLSPPNNIWPYCAADPSVYRITVRATAGPVARQATVTIQSIIRVAE